MSRSTPIVLSRFVRVDEDILNPKPKPKQTASRPLSCVSRRAIGVSRSNDADKALNHLLLETHLVDAPALSRLTLGGKAGIRHMQIHAIDYKLILLGSRLPIGDTNFSPLTSQVYLVYDAVQQSITMIPSHPWLKTPRQPGEMRKTAASIRVLIAPRPPGGYALVHMAETTINYGRNHSSVRKEDVLYVWRSWTSCRWDRITTNFPPKFKGHNAAHSLSTVLAFSCGGRAFWVNLLRGIMYCSLDALLSPSSNGNGDTKLLEFRFMRLPAKLPREITEHLMGAMEMNSDMFRTMGRAGESSIKFVTIDGFVQLKDFVDCTVRVWSRSLLDHDMMTSWTERSLSLGSIAEQDAFKTAGVPKDMVPMYPSLSPEPCLSPEEEDIVYFMLGKYNPCCYNHEHYYNSKERCKAYAITAGKPMYQLRVDMRHGLLLSSARLPRQTSPSVTVADSSVVPSPMVPSAPTILKGSTVGRKTAKRSRTALTS